MTARAALLGTTAAAGAAAAWTGIASATFLAGAGLWGAFPYPSWQWWSYLPFASSNPTVAFWLKASAVVATAFVAAGALRFWPKLRGSRPLHGETHFASAAEAQRAGLSYDRQPPGDGFLLGLAPGPFGVGRRFVSLRTEEHAALLAPPRSGKAVSIICPLLFSWAGSCIAVSVKRDLVRDAAAARAAMGQQVFVFDPGSSEGRSHRWNPLGHVPRGGPECFDAVAKVFQHLIPDTKSNNPYWVNASRRIAVAVAVLLAETPGAALNVAAVKRLLGRPDYDDALRTMIGDARTAGRPYPAAAVDAILGWLARAGDEGAAGVRDNALVAMSLWDNPVIAAATEASDFDLATLRQQPATIFVCAEVADIRRLRPLIALFFQELIAATTRQEFRDLPEPKHRVAVICDEMAGYGEVRAIADASAFVASSGLRFLFVAQAKQQLHSLYGENGAEGIFANVGCEILFGGVDQRLAEEVSRRGGDNTVAEVSTNRPRFWSWLSPGKQSESEAAKRRALMLPQEVARLPRDQLLVLRRFLPPLKLKRIEWFTDPHFARMAAPAPAIPALTITVERDAGP